MKTKVEVKATIENLREITCPLYHKYPNQQQPQQAYIELDFRYGIVLADYSGEIGNAVPNYYRQKMAVRWSIPPETNNSSLRALLANPCFLQACQKILDGFETFWDGCNRRGKHTNEAEKMFDQVQQIISDTLHYVEVWDVNHWLFLNSTLRDHWNEQKIEEAVVNLKYRIKPYQMIHGDIEDALIARAISEYNTNPDSLTEAQVRELSTRDLI